MKEKMDAFPGVINLTSRKAAGICTDEGSTFKVTGFVLTNDDGRKCVVDMSAVRWLSQDEHWRIMHPQPLQTRLETFEYSVKVWVVTKHGSDLEFVLSSVEERNNLARTHYTDGLMDMLIARFSGNTDMMVGGMGVCGDVSLTIRAKTEKDLEIAVVWTGGVVDEWIRKNNVNRMKR